MKKRILSLLLCGAMLFSLCPQSVLAEGSAQDSGQITAAGGLCEHHTEHDADCGYTEGSEGTPCTHEHSEDCYTEVTECVHEHSEDCYPEEAEDSVSGNDATPSDAEEREPENCPHICDEDSGCITKELNCQHEHDDECGYVPATEGTPCGYVCEICTGETEEQTETDCICTALCTTEAVNEDCPVCGAEDANLALCEGEEPATLSNAEAVTVASVQAMIDDLPNADEITDDNAEEVKEQLEAIDEAKAQLSDEEIDELDFSRYIEAAAALEQLLYGTATPSNALMLLSDYDGPAIVIGIGGITGYSDTNSFDYIYFGDWTATDSKATSGPIKWRVLDDQTNTGGNGFFLLSDVLLGTGESGGVYFDNTRNPNSNAWQGSDAQKWCNSFYSTNLTQQEQNAVLATTKSDEAYTSTSSSWNTQYDASENILSGDKVFFLSVEEAETGNYGFTNNNTRTAYYGNSRGVWLLRSLRAGLSEGFASLVSDFGEVSSARLYDAYAVRPAFNLDLNAVLFTSAAVGGKSSGAVGADSLQTISDYSGNEWKLTLKDDSRSFSVTETTAANAPGGTITLNYTGATAGTNEYISAIIEDSNGAQYYGRLKNITVDAETSGTVELTIPSGLAEGSYTLKVFSEQCNGDKMTDYASDFVDIPLTVDEDTITYTLTVDRKGGVGGTTGGSYTEGAVIAIDAGTRPAYRFSGWTSSNGGSFADASSASTTFTMPAEDTTITASWQYDADIGQAIQPDTGGITGYSDTGSYDYIYFGYWEASDSYTTSGPIKWRVLDDQSNTGGAGLFLLSDVGLGTEENGGVYYQHYSHQDPSSGEWHKGAAPSDGDHSTCQISNAWQGSDAQDWCKAFYSSNLTTQEQSAVLATTKSDGAYTSSSSYSFVASENILSGDRVFFLSAEEAETGDYGFTDNNSRIAWYGNDSNRRWNWWLRSPLAHTIRESLVYYYNGSVRDDGGSFGISMARPAFNLNLASVLFTSAAVGSKADAVVDSSLTAVGNYDGNEWKLTLKDDSRNNFTASTDSDTAKYKGYSDWTVDVSFENAQTGDNEYVSVLLCDSSDNVLYYGRIAQNKESGTASVTIPSGLEPDSYTLKVFSEQYNGDKMTDYAGNFVAISLTVTLDTVAPTLTEGTVSRTSDNEATVKFTSDEDGTYYYAVVESGETEPDIDTTGTGTACDTTEQTISLDSLTGAGAKDIYIVVKDAAGNVSDPLKMTIPAYTEPSYSISAFYGSLGEVYFASRTEGYTSVNIPYVTIFNTGTRNVTVALPASENYIITAQTGFAGDTADLAPGGTARFSVTPKIGLAAGNYDETLTISGSNGASASIELSFTVVEIGHTHQYGTDWKASADTHWHECSCGTRADYSRHQYDDEQDMICNVCGYDRTVAPTSHSITVQTEGSGTASASTTSATAGTTINLTATASNGYHFKEWQVISGGVTISGDSFTMPDENVTVKAIFEQDNTPPQPTAYTVTVQTEGDGTASASTTSATAGTTINLTATPNSGYRFKEWQVISGSVTINGNSFTMPDENVTVKAVFEQDSTPPQPTTYTVEVQTEGSGTASASVTSATAGTTINLTATASNGYHFKEWQVISGSVTINGNSFTMPDANVTVKAIFEQDSTPPQPTTYTVTVRTEGDGTASASATSATAGTEIKLTATPNSGYRFKEWQVISGGVTISGDSFTMPDENVTVKAIFEQDSTPPQPTTYTVTINGGGAGVSGNGSYTQGTTVNIYAGTRSGYTFTGWSTEDVTIQNADSANASFTMPGKDVAVTATWTYNGGGSSGGGHTTTYYTLTFETNGGSAIAKVTGTYGKTIDLSSYVPTRDGYDFSGWYSDKELTNKITSIKLTGNKTVYAGWTESSEVNPDTGAGNPFTDVKETDWFYDDVMFVYENGLMVGTSGTTFSPYNNTTRAQIAVIFYRLAGSPAVEGKNTFTDVEYGPGTAWYYDAVTWVQQSGIMGGYGNNLFGPNDPVTREQLASIFYNYAKYKGYDVSTTGSLDRFTDKDSVSAWAQEAMKWAVGNGIINGKENNILDPKGTATRAEIAAMLHRFIEKYKLVPAASTTGNSGTGGGTSGWVQRTGSPMTGDGSHMGLWLFTLCTSAGALAALLIFKRREDEENSRLPA